MSDEMRIEEVEEERGHGQRSPADGDAVRAVKVALNQLLGDHDPSKR